MRPFHHYHVFFCLIWNAALLIFSYRCWLVWELFQSPENLYAQGYHTLQVHCFFEQSRFRRETATLAPLVFHCSHILYNLVSFKLSWYQCFLELIYQNLFSFSRYGANVEPFLCSRVVWPALYHFNFLSLTESFDLSFKLFSVFWLECSRDTMDVIHLFLYSFTPRECFVCSEHSLWNW